MHSQHQLAQQAFGWLHQGPWRCLHMQWVVWVTKGASIMAVVVVGGGCRTAWSWAGLAKTGLQRILVRIRHHHLQHGRMTGTGCSHMGRLLASQYAADICRQRGQVCLQ